MVYAQLVVLLLYIWQVAIQLSLLCFKMSSNPLGGLHFAAIAKGVATVYRDREKTVRTVSRDREGCHETFAIATSLIQEEQSLSEPSMKATPRI